VRQSIRKEFYIKGALLRTLMRTDFVPLIYLVPTVKTKPTNHRAYWSISYKLEGNPNKGFFSTASGNKLIEL